MNANLSTHDSEYKGFIDLRSDTVTHPTPEMRRAMAEAEVGDDVYGDDPTVNKLEAMAAEMLGKEAAVYVPSGTMANVAATMSYVRRGDEVIVGSRSHMYLNEQGAMAALCQAQAMPI
nr:DegT/DnrJ/EryC1/StrS family aminotransferase [Chloroflexota bacterium]